MWGGKAKYFFDTWVMFSFLIIKYFFIILRETILEAGILEC